MKGIVMSEVSPKEKKKLEEAEENYQEIMEEIKPFVKKDKLKRNSTTGKWKYYSSETNMKY